MAQTESSGLTYRPDIDGLRAVAILLVLVFHAAPEIVGGGFIGVDVFFVISGFLITGIIVQSLDRGVFSIADFYSRRVRRIFPALLVVSIACLGAGWLLLLPDEYSALGRHVAAGAAFLSNIALWREAGYFDTASDSKPLLHLWSLGIEEQFYLVWPLALAGLHRARIALMRGVSLFALLSFVLCLVLTGRNPTAAFYFPLSRFFELLIGAFLSCALREGSIRAGLRTRQVLSGAGTGLIAGAAFLLNESSAFPGFAALAPALGAAFLIAAGPDAWVNRNLLASGGMVAIGLISYPLYLWHWPLLSFSRIVHAATPSAGWRMALVAVAFVAATLTYLFVEKPLRHGARPRRVVAGLCGAMLCIAALGVAVRLSNGVESRFADPEIRMLLRDLNQDAGDGFHDRVHECPKDSSGTTPSLVNCQISGQRPTHAIWGDSHARRLFVGIADVDRSRSWLLLSDQGCPPVAGIRVAMYDDRCEVLASAKLAQLVREPTIHTVVLAFMSAYLPEDLFAADHIAHNPGAARIAGDAPDLDRVRTFARGLAASVQALEDAGKRVVFFIDNPEFPFFPRDCVRGTLFGRGADACLLPATLARERQRGYRDALTTVQALHPGVRAFDSLPLFCPGETCDYRGPGIIYFKDSHHLSARGAQKAARSFLAWLDAPEAQGPPEQRPTPPVR